MVNTKKPGEPTTSFTVDSDTTSISDVPTITRLLNRKKLENSTTSTQDQGETTKSSAIELSVEPSIAISDQAAPSEATVLTLSPTSSSEPHERELPQKKTSTPRVQPTQRSAERRTTARLALWNAQQLKTGNDPLGKGLSFLLEKGAKFSLFLATAPNPTNAGLPNFVASAAIAPQEKLQLWTGLKWDPAVMPEMWNVFVRTGYVELSPPGAATNIKSNRNVVRGAFGLNENEWLLIVRVGPANQCRGVLALISDKSILTELSQAMPLLAALPSSASKKSA